MAISGRKPVNPNNPYSLFTYVKLPVASFFCHPKGPKGALGLNYVTTNIGPPIFLKNSEKVKDLLKSEEVKNIKKNLRKKGCRGLEIRQIERPILKICPRCKEEGNPIIEWAEKYVPTSEISRRHLGISAPMEKDRELRLHYNHKPGSQSKRCRICIVTLQGEYVPFKNSKIDLRGLYSATRVISDITKRD